jgi:DNA replication and repair protein RecF
MIFRTLSLENFRNIESLSFSPGEGVNVIWGDNAQGKTNLVEALWLFTGAKSFRRPKDAELVRFGAEYAALRASFFSEGRDQTAEIAFSPSRSMKKNGIEIRSPSDYAGTCGGVVFSPEQMNFFRAGPKERRRLIDTSLCQISPKYLSVLSDYKKVAEQRNSLLKDTKSHAQLLDLLDVYDEQLARLGGILTRARVRYGRSLGRKPARSTRASPRAGGILRRLYEHGSAGGRCGRSRDEHGDVVRPSEREAPRRQSRRS